MLKDYQWNAKGFLASAPAIQFDTEAWISDPMVGGDIEIGVIATYHMPKGNTKSAIWGNEVDQVMLKE